MTDIVERFHHAGDFGPPWAWRTNEVARRRRMARLARRLRAVQVQIGAMAATQRHIIHDGFVPLHFDQVEALRDETALARVALPPSPWTPEQLAAMPPEEAALWRRAREFEAHLVEQQTEIAVTSFERRLWDLNHWRAVFEDLRVLLGEDDE